MAFYWGRSLSAPPSGPSRRPSEEVKHRQDQRQHNDQHCHLVLGMEEYGLAAKTAKEYA